MSGEDPLLHKMDALLKKHRGDSGDAAPAAVSPAPEAPAPTAPAPGWLPVLTQVIERGAPPDAPLPPPADAAGPLSAIEPEPGAAGPDDEAALVERLMQALAPRLTGIVEQNIAAELHRTLDQTLASLLAQLDVHVRESVRDALSDALKPPRE